jgi:streptogramin lyase
MRRCCSFFCLPLAWSLCLLLAGCSLQSTSATSPDRGLAIQGSVHGGQQPIVGAHVYLFAANTTGYAGPGIAASTSNASASLLNSAFTGNSDAIGAYVLTDSNGNFTISGDYTCTANTQVYLYALGGNQGSVANPAAGLLAALGNCPAAGNFLAPIPFISVNEVSTIAAAYAFSGFATDATHVSSSGSTLAQAGIKTAFANAANLVAISTGAALTTTPATNGAVPQTEINTLGNVLASCVNSNGAVTGPTNPTTCYTLFVNASSGGSTGVQPTDTATAAINIAHNPGVNISALYALAQPTPPFGPALTALPGDFTIGIKLTGAGLDVPENIAIDGAGNAWVVNSINSISELASSGAAISPSTGGFYGIGGFTGIVEPYDVAIDTSGNVWISNPNSSYVTELNSSATNVTGSPFTTGTGSRPTYLAIDGSNNVWITSAPGSGSPSVVELSSAGAILSGTGYTGGGLSGPYGIALDYSGNAWLGNNTSGTLSKFSSAGTPNPSSPYSVGSNTFPHGIAVDGSGRVWVPTYAGNIALVSNSGTLLSGTGYTGGGQDDPFYVAIDGAGNAWFANEANATVSEFSSAGAPITSSFGYGFASLHGSNNGDQGIAVDASGNVWIANTENNDVVELIGAAVPVVTPLSVGVKNNTLGTRP